MARMLGQLRRGGCSNSRCRLCHQEETTRWRKRVEARELDRELDDLVAEWHDAEPGSEAASVPLHDWLGMSREEYAEWVTGADL